MLFEDGHARFVKAGDYRALLDSWKGRVVEEWKSNE
jgi:hypothetical protein